MMKIVFTDLDATLLNSQKKVSHRNMLCLKELGENNIIRVIATGRSYFSFTQVIGGDFPADYLIFSTGAGILNLHTRELLVSADLRNKDIKKIATSLLRQKVDFMVHQKVPDNHKFVYCRFNEHNKDFNRRIAIYKEFAVPYRDLGCFPSRSAQIIAIFQKDLLRFKSVEKGFNGYQVTRTTSPLDGISIWMEIYPNNVSKGCAAKWLCDYLNIDPKDSVGVGNDFNDVSLLDFTTRSYMVDNAPDELIHKYNRTRSNDHDGFYFAVNKVFQETGD